MALTGDPGTALRDALEQTRELARLADHGDWTGFAGLLDERDRALREALAEPTGGNPRLLERLREGNEALLEAVRARRDETATRLANVRRSGRGARQYQTSLA